MSFDDYPRPTDECVIVNEELREERLSICRECDRMDEPVTGVLICMECGCDLMVKTTKTDHFCPLYKWLDVERNC